MPTERNRMIRERAYQLWEAAGRLEGHDHRHWAEAEREYEAAHAGVPAKKAKSATAKTTPKTADGKAKLASKAATKSAPKASGKAADKKAGGKAKPRKAAAKAGESASVH